MSGAPRRPGHRAPLADALFEYRERGMAAYHTPGHKLGAGAPPDLAALVGSTLLGADLGVANGAEDTQESRGLVRRAEGLAAAAWGADEAFFLVNGSTSGVQAVLPAVAGPGDKVIVPRNSHKSLLAGLVFSGAMPVWVEPTLHPEWRVAVNVPTERVAECVEAHPDAKAVFVTSPSYNGFCADTRALASLAHEAGMPLVVDQAWGPHLRFCAHLPEDAMSAGADAAVTSVHKLLSGLSQASLLLARRGRIDVDRLRTLVKMTQTTSPLAPILASIDLARLQMEEEGSSLWSRALELGAEARRRISLISGLRVLHPPVPLPAGAYDFDPVRLTVSVEALGCSGYEFERLLRAEQRVAVEAADPHNVVFNITYADSAASVDLLVEALTAAATSVGPKGPLGGAEASTSVGAAEARGRPDEYDLVFPGGTRQVVTPREAFFGPSRPVPLEEAVGKVSAEMVTPYPPGIPILGPGEEVSEAVVEYLARAAARGLSVHGPHDRTLATLRIRQGGENG